MLSAQSTDKGVNKATESLFKIADSPQKMLTLGIDGLKEHIKTIGLYNNKAKSIISLSQDLVTKFNGQVPQNRQDLESLAGVGRKTAQRVILELKDKMKAEEVEEEAEESATEKLCRKCEEVKTACCDTIDRIIYDLKETNFNPYIKQTRITRVEIYRNASEEQPIDTFETTDTKSYSAKALAVASAAAALLVIASNGIVKRFLK